MVLFATFSVVVAPVLVVSILAATGAVTSFLLLIGIGMALSMGVTYAGTKIWASRPHAEGVLFGDLMLWGWIRRWQLERQLANAVSLLGLQESLASEASEDSVELSARQRVRLLKQLSTALEARYPDTHGHSRRVARHATVIAKRMGLPPAEVARIRTAAAVHDVGKIDIPDSIINKPGKLSDVEYKAIQQHSTIGAKMVSALGDKKLTRIVRYHHERLDGKGYPSKLKGKEIPLGARIIAVADTFDAVTSARPYRSARRHKDALVLLSAEAGTQLDPAAVRAFRGYYSGYRPAVLWSMLLNGPRQLIAVLAGEAKLGGMATAATIATVAAGNLAVHSFHADHAASQASAPDTASASSGTQLFAFANLGWLGAGQAVVDGSRMSHNGSSLTPSAIASMVDFEEGASAGSGDSLSTSAGSGAATLVSAPGGGEGSSPSTADSVGDTTPGFASDTPATGKGNQGSPSRPIVATVKTGSSNAGNALGKGNGGSGSSTIGTSVAVPDQASDKASSAVEDVVKGGGKPASTPPSPSPPPPPDLPPPATEAPKGPPPGEGK